MKLWDLSGYSEKSNILEAYLPKTSISGQIVSEILKQLCSDDSGADPGFFLGGGALVSCSTSTPINHIVFFCGIPVVLENRRSSWGGGGVRTPCTLPLDPPL